MAKPFYDEGLHVGEILQQGLTEAKTGTAQFMLRVKLLGVPDGSGDYQTHRNQYERTLFMPITNKTMEYFQQNLEMLGFTGDSLAQLDPSHPQHQSFVGNQVDLWCKHETYNGREQERWQLSNRKAIETRPVDAKGMKQLDMLFGRAKRAAGASSPSTMGLVNKHAGREPETITDDDIPF